MQTALLREDVQEEAHDLLSLLSGIELVSAVGAPAIPHGRRSQQVTAPRLGAPSCP